jgi:hypothetical protein
MSDTVKVEFAYPYTDAAGKNHNADATASLPRGEAVELIHYGRARAVNEAPKAAATKEQ